MHNHCKQLTNQQLIQRLKSLVGDERKIQAEFLVHLAEVDARRLYAEVGYSSLFRYCVEVLGFSEASTCKRIQVMRTARTYPMLYEYIAQGKITLSAITRISAHLSETNYQERIQLACHQSTRAVEQLVAAWAPKPDVADMIRTLPATCRAACDSTTNAITPMGPALFDDSGPTVTNDAIEEKITGSPQAAIDSAARRDAIKPLSEERVKVQFSCNDAVRRKLERAKEVLRHACPNGKLEDIIERALDALLEKKDPYQKMLRKQRQELSLRGNNVTAAIQSLPKASGLPRLAKGSTRNDKVGRYIPQRVKNKVMQRDNGQCQYIGPHGERCSECGNLEFDHIQPWALGGVSDSSNNVRLLCRTHNQLLGRRMFGKVLI